MGTRRSSVPLLEWIASAVGLLLTLGLLALIAAEAVRTPAGAAPVIEVRALAVEPAPNGFVLQFEARNRSHATAATVTIEGELGGSGETETSRAILDYVPGHSQRRGGLFFRRDPRRHPLELRALGYQEP